MANTYSFDIYFVFTIAIEHSFTQDEIDESDGVIHEVFEQFESEVQSELENYCWNVNLDSPRRRRKDNRYIFEGGYSFSLSLNECDVDVGAEDFDLTDEILDEIKATFENGLMDCGIELELLTFNYIDDELMFVDKV